MKNQALEEATIALAQALAAVMQALQEPREPDQPTTRLYSYDDLAAKFGKSKGTIRQWVCEGQFGEPVKAGSSTRVTQAGLDKFIADHSGPPHKQTSLGRGQRVDFLPGGLVRRRRLCRLRHKELR